MFNKENLPTYKDFVVIEKVFNDRFKQLTYAFELNNFNLILEFGVHKGETLTHICNINSNKTIFGFDSFQGLPREWDLGNKIITTDEFDLEKNLPVVPNNAKLVVGWFADTIPQFFNEHSDDRISILHIDCDIYESTIDVLQNCNNFLEKDSIIVFDELAHWKKIKKYKNYLEHEFRALNEWIVTFDRQIEIISRTTSFQAAIRVLK